MANCKNITAFSGTGASVVNCALTLINSVIPIIVAITVLWIIWGAFNLTKSDGEEARKEWRNAILYGIIGLFVMVSIYGFVNILIGTFSFGGSNSITTPNIATHIQAPSTP